MEENIDTSIFNEICRSVTPEDAKLMSSLSLAYIGDAVFDLLIRMKEVDMYTKTNRIHTKVSAIVKASSQCSLLKSLEDGLKDDEKIVVRRARNAKSHSVPKNAELMDYKNATAFEALLGYLFLQGKTDRIREIIQLSGIWENGYER